MNMNMHWVTLHGGPWEDLRGNTLVDELEDTMRWYDGSMYNKIGELKYRYVEGSFDPNLALYWERYWETL